MRQQRGIEQRHVGGVGEHRLLHDDVVGHRTGGADPDIVERLARLAVHPVVENHGAHLDGARPAHPGLAVLRHLVDPLLAQLVLVHQRFRAGHFGHVELVLEALSSTWNDAARVKICLPCWIATTRREVKLAAVAGAVHFVEDRNLGIAGAQEIGVEGMADAPLDRAAGGDQRLAQHLPAEDALHAVFRALAAENIFLDLSRSSRSRTSAMGVLAVVVIALP